MAIFLVSWIEISQVVRGLDGFHRVILVLVFYLLTIPV